MATVFRTPVSTRLPGVFPTVAVRAHGETWQNQLLGVLASKDTFDGLAGQPNFDQPNPTGNLYVTRGFSVQLRTWTQSPFFGTDTFFGQAGNPNDDWQNPTLAKDRSGAALRAWSDLGQNYLPQGYPSPAPPTVTIFDWPNPRGATYPSDLRTWTAGFPQELIGQDKFFGFAGNPLRDQPNPAGNTFILRTFSTQLRSWTASFPFELISKDVFFGLAGNPLRDQPNPVSANRNFSFPAQFRGYTQSTNPALFQSGKPGLQTDWPNPILLKGPRDRALRAWQETWQNYVAIGLQVTLPFSQENWPNPPGYIYPVGLRGFSESLALYLQGTLPAPRRRGPLLTSTPGGYTVWYGTGPVNARGS